MNQNIKLIALFLVFASLATMALGGIPKASAGGPVTPNLLIKIFYDPTQEENALATGGIDVNDWPLTSTFITGHATDPDITMNEYAELGMMEYDINNQLWPTGGAGGYAGAAGGSGRTGSKNEFYDPVANPRELDALHFRRAIAHLTNKDKYTTTFMGGYGYPMYTVVPVPALAGYTNYGTGFGGLTNTTAVDDAGAGGYMYPYDRAAANNELNLGNFITTGSHPSRFYDINKNGVWDAGTDEELPNMKFWIRLDDPNRRQAGEDLFNELVLAGIPAATTTGGAGLEKRIAERSTCFAQVMVNYDYNIYTGGWSVGADPDWIFDFMHSSMGQYSYANNYAGFKNEEFDFYAEEVKYPKSLADVSDAAKNAQWVGAKYIPIVHLWAAKGVKGYRTGWDGVVNLAGFGTDNAWSFDLMSRSGFDTIKYGFKSDYSALQVLTSEWLWDWNVLGLIYDTMIGRNPFNLPDEVGALATSWSATPQDWNPDHAGNETVVTFTLRSGAVFHDNSPVKASDVAFSLLAVRDAGAGNAWNYPVVMDIGKVEIAGAAHDTIKVYFNVESAFAVHWSGFMPIINKDLWWQALSQAQYGGYTHNIADDTNGFFGDYTPGGYSSAGNIRNYHPWESTAMGDTGVNDLAEDGSWSWKFVSSSQGNNVALSAFSGMYSTITWHGASLSAGDFITKAFHANGNVNYAGGHGATQSPAWYTTDRKIDLFDMTTIATSMPSSSGGTWGKGQQEYNLDADVDLSGNVDALDLSIAGTNFNKKQG